jgi:hypothetical protein
MAERFRAAAAVRLWQAAPDRTLRPSDVAAVKMALT